MRVTRDRIGLGIECSVEMKPLARFIFVAVLVVDSLAGKFNAMVFSSVYIRRCPCG